MRRRDERVCIPAELRCRLESPGIDQPDELRSESARAQLWGWRGSRLTSLLQGSTTVLAQERRITELGSAIN